MRSKTVSIDPYVILFLILSLSVLGTAWVAAQFEPSTRKLDYAQAIPGKVKLVSGVEPKQTPVASKANEPIADVKKLIHNGPAMKTTRDSYWYQYHAHLLPIAVGFFMLTLSGWSLIGVENLAMRALNS
ncbi:MAG: hypothetical protein MUC83_08275 [Pirellula sp.]|jgi:hypothetical protein|nr:hypothetical protein [Pirellula sp.]